VLARAQRLRREARFLSQLRRLPPRVALFQWRAWRLALRTGDEFARVSATRPSNLALLLDVARERSRVVELGTANAWTAISLALADRARAVVTYDPIERPERDQYLQLVSPATRRQVTFVRAPGDEGPRDSRAVDLLYIDSTHDREETVREVHAWRAVLAAHAVIVFDDFAHPEYPGVQEAVRELGLRGDARGGFFVHHA
jgi:hypothetical protein